MSNPYYDGDSNIRVGEDHIYSRLDNMDHMEMDEKLIADSKPQWLTRNLKWVYAIVGVVTGCVVTVGICYLFFYLGKEKGYVNITSNVGAMNSVQKQTDVDQKTTPNNTDLFKLLLTKEDNNKIMALLQEIRNQSQKELLLLQQSKDQILQLLAEIKNKTAREEILTMTDCVDWKTKGFTESGLYIIYPTKLTSIEVYCEMDIDQGGWIVFQRRVNGTTNFYRDWQAYEDGFGDKEQEFWLGNKYLNILTSASMGTATELRVDVEDWEGEKRYAKYSSFSIGDAASKYTLYAEGYSGDAGDGLALHHKVKFSTYDQDNDVNKRDCARTGKGAWWYENCSHSSLNGEYKRDGIAGKNEGINWEKFKGDHYSMKSASMMLRRKL